MLKSIARNKNTGSSNNQRNGLFDQHQFSLQQQGNSKVNPQEFPSRSRNTFQQHIWGQCPGAPTKKDGTKHLPVEELQSITRRL